MASTGQYPPVALKVMQDGQTFYVSNDAMEVATITMPVEVGDGDCEAAERARTRFRALAEVSNWAVTWL